MTIFPHIFWASSSLHLPSRAGTACLGSCKEHTCIYILVCTRHGLGQRLLPASEGLLGICMFLASLCSLSNLVSACSVNPSLKPRERLVKLHFSYNQFETSFSLLSTWALRPSFFQSANIHSPYNHPHISSPDFLLCSPFLHVFSHSCFIFND